MQLEGNILRVREALHGGSGEHLLEQPAPFHRHAVERRGVLALQVNAHGAYRAADATKEIALDGEHTRIG